MKLIYLFIINIKKYGLFDSLKIIIFEIYYALLKINLLNTLLYTEEKNENYENKFKFKKFNSPYAPCPYYFLYLISNVINNEMGLNKFNLIDFGCGRGRVLSFFKNKFKRLYGIDINNNFTNFYNKNDCKFIKSDCRKKSIFSFLKKKKNFLFFYQPFDDNTILKIINIYKKESSNLYFVLINFNKAKKIKKFYKIYEKKFNCKSKNILIYKQFISR